nr:hypothetical protein [Angustibacter aerolatus]
MHVPDLHWLVQRPRLTAVTWVLHAVVDVTTILTMLEPAAPPPPLVPVGRVRPRRRGGGHRLPVVGDASPAPPAPGRTSRAEGSGR